MRGELIHFASISSLISQFDILFAMKKIVVAEKFTQKGYFENYNAKNATQEIKIQVNSLKINIENLNSYQNKY